MEKYNIEVKTNITVTQEDIDDIMCTALEGGITYWCRKAKVIGEYLGEYGHEQIARGGTLELYDAEEEKDYLLTRDKLLKGIKLAYEQNYYLSYGWCDGHSLDTCQVDASVADVIVQFALFDDVVYG